MAGPFAGGRKECVHSVAMHDMLWRDEPSATTPAGIHFHERRLELIRTRETLRVFTSSPGLDDRLVDAGVDRSRVHPVRLGVDDDGVEPADAPAVAALLFEHGVVAPFTLYVGTREPRKNLQRLIAAHSRARAAGAQLGPLVLVGPGGWGDVDSADATVLGLVPRAVLKGLYRDATVFAYVPRAEGWGLPPVEALYAGTRVVASTTTPSVRDNVEVITVDPLDVDSIAHGLSVASSSGDDEASRHRRRGTVAHLTWRNVALDHVAGWR
jgi:glycosyltransferase involved in cell wall biosynthesis